MNRRTYEEERLRGVHLRILIVLSIAVTGIVFSASEFGWDEAWMMPFLSAGVLVCWLLHIRQMFSPDVRLYIYAGVSFAAVIIDGIHPSSVFDIAISTVLIMTLFSQDDHPRILTLGFLVYLFLLARQIMMLVEGKSLPLSPDVIIEVACHALIVLVVYVIVLGIVRRRMADAAADAREIEALKELRKRTEDFLTNVSHELRTPINAVTGLGSVMVRDAKTEQTAERATGIFTAGRRLGDQVTDMLDYTEIDTGRLIITEEAYSVSSLAGDVAAECGFLEKEKAERITIELAEGIPDRLLGGGRWLKKLLRHQIEHALQLSDGGDIRVTVSAKPRDYGVNLCMEVCHTGGMVSGEDLERVKGGNASFKKGERHRIDAFKLGLRIIYGLAHAMDGFVRMKRGDDNEVLVQTSIPQRIAQEAARGGEQLTAHTVIRVQTQSAVPQAGEEEEQVQIPAELRALVVDDEPLNLLVARGIFADYDMTVDTAESGKEAIEKVRGAAYDVIFMDHMMPEMDGVEAAHHIKGILAAQERDTKIVALTANAVSGAREMFLREGFDGFVAKPVRRAELERTLKELSLRGRQA